MSKLGFKLDVNQMTMSESKFESDGVSQFVTPDRRCLLFSSEHVFLIFFLNCDLIPPCCVSLLWLPSYVTLYSSFFPTSTNPNSQTQ